MTKITQPSQGRRAESTGSAFIKPPLRRGVAVVGTSSLVLGMVIGGGSLAAANNPLCVSGQIITPINNPPGREQEDAIQDAMEDGLVCLAGDFVLQSGIFFEHGDPVKIIGLESASITKDTDNTNAVFENSWGDASIEIENVDISSNRRVVNGYAVEIRDSVFTKIGGEATLSSGGAINAQGPVTISNSTLSGFKATGSGGAIWASGNVTVSTDSTFSENTATVDGGAIWTSGNVTVSSDSTFSENTATRDGGAIRASGAATVSGSTLSDNTATRDGGALYIDGSSTITNSTFSGNQAPSTVDAGRGGAIWGSGTVSASRSTFVDNKAFLGGAVYGHRDPIDPVGGNVNLSNSTFFRNVARELGAEGGAVFAHSGGVYFSTFVNNEAPAPLGGDTPGNAIYKTGAGLFEIGANIFSGDSNFPQLGVGLPTPTGFTDLGGNVFSTLDTAETPEIEEVSERTLFGKSLSLLFGTSSPVLATYAPNASGTQTIGLASGSPALGIVPNRAPFTSDTYNLDQRGATRIDPRDAGAFQGVAPIGGSGSSADFTVFSLPAGITKPGSEVKVTGANLNLVKEIYVNGVKVKIKKQSAASLVFTAPRGLTGVVDVRFVSAASQYNAFRGLDFGSSAASGTKARTVVGGFAANSTRLSMKMKREIRAFLRTNTGFSSVTCMGFTSDPATTLDAALAKARGQVTCNYIKRLDPDLKVKVVQGRHTELPGSKIRRVRITIE